LRRNMLHLSIDAFTGALFVPTTNLLLEILKVRMVRVGSWFFLSLRPLRLCVRILFDLAVVRGVRFVRGKIYFLFYTKTKANCIPVQ